LNAPAFASIKSRDKRVALFLNRDLRGHTLDATAAVNETLWLSRVAGAAIFANRHYCYAEGE
jgi:hypothetical protein